MSHLKSLKGLVALVTGGASGLGLGTMRRLVSAGAQVMICDLPSSTGEEIASACDHNVAFTPADVTSEDDVKNVLANISDKFGKLDAVVNCAAISIAYQVMNFETAVAHIQEDFERVSKVNSIGTFNVNRLAAGLIGKNSPDSDGQRGVIINVTGCQAFDGQKGQSAFTASAGAVVGMTLPLARDLAPQGIRCCSIATGLFDTPLTECVPEHVREQLILASLFPVRLGRPDEFAHLVQFLIENPFINGECIRIDAGLKMDL